MSYRIKKYSFEKAKKLNVVIKPSKNKNKKIDVFSKDGKKLASVGAKGMNDYPTYLEKEKQGLLPEGTATKRRKLYKQRHEKDRHKRGSNGFFADKILW
jgi:hypothetical protein